MGSSYSHPDAAFYLRQIVELARLGIGQVQREVKLLTAAGIIRRENRGRHVYFQADPSCLFEELRGIVSKTLGGAARMRLALDPLRHRIAIAFIHGSVARGEERQGSDLDLIVVGKATFAEIAGAIRDAEADLQRPINPTVYPVREFRDKLRAGNHFLQTVMKGRKCSFWVTSMSLDLYLRNGWIRRHETAPQEIQSLLAVSDRDIAQSQTPGLGPEWRFDIAYNAAVQLAVASLAASGFRAERQNKHQRSIECLAFTLGLEKRGCRSPRSLPAKAAHCRVRAGRHRVGPGSR